MRPDQTAPPTADRPATGEPASARAEPDRLRTTRRSQRQVLDALGEAVSALRATSAALLAESAKLCLRSAALRAENAERRAARPLRAGPGGGGVGVEARETRALALDVRAPAKARSVVTEFLNDRVPARVLESARVVVSELVTNSVRHSGVANGVVVIGVELSAAKVRLDVADPGRGGDIRPGPPDAVAGRGFGLQLVQSLSEQWGLERAVSGGTRVWAQLLRVPPAGGAGAGE
jgi:anti-sigma regulatory factor (Ser/Thr protein kinase)